MRMLLDTNVLLDVAMEAIAKLAEGIAFFYR